MILETAHAPLLARNTFGIDVNARMLVEYSSVADLKSIAPVAEPFIHLGGGSNLLFLGDCSTLLLHSLISGISIVEETVDEVTVRVGSGVVWDDFVAWAVASGLSGVENLSIIPGEVGAAAVQNIGAYGAEIKDVVESVDTIDMSTGSERRFSAKQCEYGYRSSVFKRPDMKHYVVTYVTMSLRRRFTPDMSYHGLFDFFERSGLQPTPATMRRAVITLRHSKLPDPTRLGNAGSFFTNPVVDAELARSLSERYPGMPQYPATVPGKVKLSGGWLIEKAGWKGRRIGPAGVDERQALVIVNHGGATGADIVRVMESVIEDVKERFGVTLVPEVNIIG